MGKVQEQVQEQEQVCHYCKEDPGKNPNNQFDWNGFRDMDMQILVCWKCRNHHYAEKNKTEYKNLYSEFPVIIR